MTEQVYLRCYPYVMFPAGGDDSFYILKGKRIGITQFRMRLVSIIPVNPENEQVEMSGSKFFLDKLQENIHFLHRRGCYCQSSDRKDTVQPVYICLCKNAVSCYTNQKACDRDEVFHGIQVLNCNVNMVCN